MTPKLKAFTAAVIAGISAFLAYLANTPPSQQDELVAPLVDLMPVTWRPAIGLAMRALSSFATIYMAVQASHSGPSVKLPLALFLAALLFTGCAPIAAYNSTVASRTDSLAIDRSKEGFGGAYTHSVTYR